MTILLFAYGSLVGRESAGAGIGRALRAEDGPFPARLVGFRRAWTVGSDRTSHPERHLAWSDGRRFEGTLAVLGLHREADAWCNGALYRLRPSDLDALAARERNYTPSDVTAGLVVAAEVGDGPVVAYLPRPEALDRLRSARAAGLALVRREYAAAVRSAFERLGHGQLDAFTASTTPHGLSLHPLSQVAP